MKRLLQNILVVASLCGLFSQGAFAQMPGTFAPLAAVAAGGGVLDCLGGTVTYSGGKTIHTFTTVGNSDFYCPTARTITYLAVAGGGAGGGASYSGGGGAGGLLTGTVTVPAAISTVIVGAGGVAVASARGGSGGNSSIITPGGAGSFYTLLPTPLSLAVFGTSFTNYESRTRFNTATYSGTAPTVGTQIRVTITGGGAGANALNGLWCGHAGGTGTNLNFDGSQVQIKFSGSNGVTVPTGAATLVSDAVNYSFDKSKDFICSENWGSNAAVGNQSLGNANILGGNSAGTGPTNAGNTTTTATGAASSTYLPVSQIEVFSTATVVAQAIGGGGGGQYSTTVAGAPGGSGGGTAYGSNTGAAAGTAGQGNAGGNSAGAGCGSGGGGAGAVGVNCTAPNGSNGGAGLQSSITGASLWYAAGGGGGPYTGIGGTGGSGIGGNGGNYSPATACTNGAPNTGSGGGGIASTGLCNGGSGIVVISYSSGTPNPNCVGGTITTVGANTVHTFTTSGAISCATPKSINYLIVAGGGYGGAHAGSGTYPPGGGGAGGLKTGTAVFLAAGITSVTVGAGSPAPSSAYSSPPCSTAGTSGGNSSIQFIASANGGGDGLCGGNSRAGNNGGSGGGSILGNTAGSGTSGQGNNGGVGNGSTSASSGGAGGGCGAVGQAGGTTAGAIGGTGCSSSITGTSVCYAGGGGAGLTLASGAAGTATCGGGQGGASGTGPNIGTAGAANTGGGGGASSSTSAAATGSAGGSGIVVVSYATGTTATPPPGNWYALITTQAPASAGSGFTNYELRTRFKATGYQAGAPSTGTKFRITVTGGGTTTNGITQAWCGHAGAALPSLNYDGGQTQVTFSGNANLALPTGQVVSDAIPFPFDKTQDFICSFWNTGSTVSYNGALSATVGIGSNSPGTGSNAGATTAGGGITGGTSLWNIVQIEIFG